jgi:hypothetical protein
MYYYRELQNLRDPLHFQDTPMPKRRDAGDASKRKLTDSRKSAIRRWVKNAKRSNAKNN